MQPLPERSTVRGKEKIVPAEKLVREAVKLNNNPDWWKVLIACRLDLETETIDVRYVAKDEGNSYSITTDDVTIFLRDDKWENPEYKDMFVKAIRKIEDYNSIFELAKASLYLPQYFNDFENDIVEEQHETKVKSIISNPLRKSKYKNVDVKFKLRTRSLWLLNRNNIFSSDTVVLRDDKFKIETSGYWKDLSPDEVGIDKKGNKITGRTWVNKTESYFQAKAEELIITKTKQEKEFNEKNAGYIYIMRNAALEESIFKIGRTAKETKERAKQLSKTSIPDQYYIMREWHVRDCIKAEKEIHEFLNDYRVNPRREFFKIDMRKANETIDKVVEKINAKEN
ncbi:MAG: GIY-YIG nuclease family protein [Niabella sp.]|nr:GIY-YIG nuclease family protein [Niabella sp.]